MTSPKFSTVDSYLTAIDPVKAKTLRAILDFSLSRFPELEEKVSWNVPTLHRQGKYVVGLAAYKHHLTVSVFSALIIADFEPRLEGYKVFKNCFQIPVDWDPDHTLINDLVKARLTELGSA